MLSLTRTSRELLSEQEELDLIVTGNGTSTGNSTENVGTSTLEQGLVSFLLQDFSSALQGRRVLDGFTRSLQIRLNN